MNATKMLAGISRRFFYSVLPYHADPFQPSAFIYTWCSTAACIVP